MRNKWGIEEPGLPMPAYYEPREYIYTLQCDRHVVYVWPGNCRAASRFCHAQVPCKIPCKSLAVKRGCAKGSQWEHREIARKHDDIFAQLFTTKTALQTALQVPCKCRAEQNSTKSALQRRTLTLLEDPTLKWPHAERQVSNTIIICVAGLPHDRCQAAV